MLGGRPISSILKAVAKPANYTGVVKTFSHCTTPINFLRRYLTGAGEYPTGVSIRTPIGVVELTAFGPDDILTINEIFFRGDYGNRSNDKVIVDFGSNIGISAGYFLSRNRDAYCYCHEPLPQNAERLRHNLRSFPERYELRELAVAEADGEVSFGWEPTGRYGGIGKTLDETITVPALDSNSVLRDVIARHGRIDLLKIDIESLEYELTVRIPRDVAANIRRIVIELPFDDNPLPETHEMAYSLPITTLVRKGAGISK